MEMSNVSNQFKLHSNKLLVIIVPKIQWLVHVTVIANERRLR